MEIVHVTCGFCGKDFRVTKEAMAELDTDECVGHYLRTSLRHQNSITAVDIGVTNNKHDLCAICVIQGIEAACVIWRAKSKELMNDVIVNFGGEDG